MRAKYQIDPLKSVVGVGWSVNALQMHKHGPMVDYSINMVDYSINTSVKKNSNIPNDLAEIVNFHFSYYKSMGTISCHSNQSSYTTGIKNTTYVEANVLSMYAKFRLHPLYGF